MTGDSMPSPISEKWFDGNISLEQACRAGHPAPGDRRRGRELRASVQEEAQEKEVRLLSMFLSVFLSVLLLAKVPKINGRLRAPIHSSFQEVDRCKHCG
jgi:hypothetical protein